MTRITRVEVITDQGRDYVNWKDDNDITVSYQDNEKTLKIFVNTVKPKTGEEGALEALEEWLGPQGPVGPGPGPKGVIDGEWEEWLGPEPPQEPKLLQIEQLKKGIANLQNRLKLLEYQETVRTDVEKAYRDFYGHYPIIDMSTNDYDAATWIAFKEGYKAGQKPKEYQPTPEEPEELKTLYDSLQCPLHINGYHFNEDQKDWICDIVKEWMSQYADNVMCGEYKKGYEYCLAVLEENLKND